jgi:hypothetical protein
MKSTYKPGDDVAVHVDGVAWLHARVVRTPTYDGWVEVRFSHEMDKGIWRLVNVANIRRRGI